MVANVSDEEMQEHYDNFFEDVFVECEDKVEFPIPFKLLAPGLEFKINAVMQTNLYYDCLVVIHYN